MNKIVTISREFGSGEKYPSVAKYIENWFGGNKREN